MKALILAATVSALAIGGVANAQSYDQRDHQSYDQRSEHRGYDHHSGWAQDRGADHQWRHGERMGYNDWNNARPVDYRQHHLRHPPRGYEWRESNGQYVMAAVATGVIASMIINSNHH